MCCRQFLGAFYLIQILYDLILSIRIAQRIFITFIKILQYFAWIQMMAERCRMWFLHIKKSIVEPSIWLNIEWTYASKLIGSLVTIVVIKRTTIYHKTTRARFILTFYNDCTQALSCIQVIIIGISLSCLLLFLFLFDMAIVINVFEFVYWWLNTMTNAVRFAMLYVRRFNRYISRALFA